MDQSTKSTAAHVVIDDAALEGSDEELGRHFWNVYLRAWRVETHCFAPIEAIVEQIRSSVRALEADNPANNSVEKALRKAAEGDFSAAGRSIRYHMMDKAHKIAAAPLIARGIAAAKKSKGFSEKGIGARREVGEGNRRTVKDAAAALMARRNRPYDSTNQLVQDIVKETGLKKTAIYEHLAALDLTIKK